MPGVHFLPLPWLTPSPDEPIGDYAGRMRTGIRAERPVLVGVSFGGMMAIEMAKELPGATVVILSSVSDDRQIPLWIKIGGRLYPRRLISGLKKPGWRPSRLEDHFLGVETIDDRLLVNEFRNTVQDGYVHWAIRTIARWRNRWKPASFYHIHGGRDRIFPLRKVRATHVVGDGGHLMVYNRAEAVSGILAGILRTTRF